MCGRYSLFTPATTLEDRFDATFPEDLEPRYNCAPGQSLPVVASDDPDEARRMEWGLTPSWADERHEHINARAETAAEKPAFRGAYERRRCLVPADGFYEWVPEGSGKQPYRVTFADDRPFAMAGLWERWTPSNRQAGLADFDGDGPGDADAVETYTILTTEPNELVADLHDRMPVILPRDAEAEWLACDLDGETVRTPHPAAEMTAYPVSTRVNAPGNDDPSLVEPLDG